MFMEIRVCMNLFTLKRKVKLLKGSKNKLRSVTKSQKENLMKISNDWYSISD